MKKNKRTVLASGVFDLIHSGHLYFLEKAKEAGGKESNLTVIIARDITIRKMKGKLPVLPEEERRAVVEALKPVDIAVLGSRHMDISNAIDRYNPDIIAVGYDQKRIEGMVKKILSDRKLKTEIVRIPKFGRGIYNSSSKIKRRVVKSVRS